MTGVLVSTVSLSPRGRLAVYRWISAETPVVAVFIEELTEAGEWQIEPSSGVVLPLESVGDLVVALEMARRLGGASA